MGATTKQNNACLGWPFDESGASLQTVTKEEHERHKCHQWDSSD